MKKLKYRDEIIFFLIVGSVLLLMILVKIFLVKG
jgi:hypothetical protein